MFCGKKLMSEGFLYRFDDLSDLFIIQSAGVEDDHAFLNARYNVRFAESQERFYPVGAHDVVLDADRPGREMPRRQCAAAALGQVILNRNDEAGITDLPDAVSKDLCFPLDLAERLRQ